MNFSIDLVLWALDGLVDDIHWGFWNIFSKTHFYMMNIDHQYNMTRSKVKMN